MDLLRASIPQADLEAIRVEKTGLSADEIERLRLQLLLPILGEFSNEPPLARDDLLWLHCEILCPKPELVRLSHDSEAIGRLDQRLARHAAFQDAQTA